MSAAIQNYTSSLHKSEKSKVSFLAYYGLHSLDTIQKQFPKPIVRFVAPNLHFIPCYYTGLVKPVPEVIWLTGEYLIQNREDGCYLLGQIFSYSNVTFDFVLAKKDGFIFRQIVEHDVDSPYPYSLTPLTNIRKEVGEHTKMSIYFEKEAPYMKFLVVDMAESVLS